MDSVDDPGPTADKGVMSCSHNDATERALP
jgi:hypothetical protein